MSSEMRCQAGWRRNGSSSVRRTRRFIAVFGPNPINDYLRAIIAYLPLVFVAPRDSPVSRPAISRCAVEFVVGGQGPPC